MKNKKQRWEWQAFQPFGRSWQKRKGDRHKQTDRQTDKLKNKKLKLKCFLKKTKNGKVLTKGQSHSLTNTVTKLDINTPQMTKKARKMRPKKKKIKE